MKEYRLMSIDESSKKTGCALYISGELVDSCLIDLSKMKDSKERLDFMCSNVLKQIKLWKPDGIAIEHPQGEGRNVLVVYMLSQIIGIAKAYAIEKKCDFYEVVPSEWRSYLGLKQGKKKRDELKQMSIDYVFENYGLTVSDDVADAICIGAGILNKYGE